jgi:hypothetical protein
MKARCSAVRPTAAPTCSCRSSRTSRRPKGGARRGRWCPTCSGAGVKRARSPPSASIRSSRKASTTSPQSCAAPRTSSHCPRYPTWGSRGAGAGGIRRGLDPAFAEHRNGARPACDRCDRRHRPREFARQGLPDRLGRPGRRSRGRAGADGIELAYTHLLECVAVGVVAVDCPTPGATRTGPPRTRTGRGGSATGLLIEKPIADRAERLLRCAKELGAIEEGG